MPEHYEIAIIGAGPGGIAAAVNAAKQEKSHVLFEKEKLGNTIYNYQLGKHVMAEPDNIPLLSQAQFKAGSREEILQSWENAITSAGVNLIYDEVSGVTKEENLFTIKLGSQTCTANRVVLAIGTQGTPRKLSIPGAELDHVAYTLSDPKAFSREHILVIGAGDAAIENALALMEHNSVMLLNTRDDFPRAKKANRKLILDAISSSKIRCYYNSQIKEIHKEKVVIETADGNVHAKCSHVIARIGAILPRKFMESCGIEFPKEDMSAVPLVSETYESNVSGLHIIGALIDYPLIKQAMNQGYEVVEHILGNHVEPADQSLIDERLSALVGSVDERLSIIRNGLPIFSELNAAQFRELILDSKLHAMRSGDLVFEEGDYTDTFFSIVEGSVEIEISETESVTLNAGEFFGELGLFSGRRRNATVRTASDSTVLLETNRNQVLKLQSSAPGVADLIDQTFVLRILQSSIFPGSSRESLLELIPKIKRKSLTKGEVLFSEGDLGDSFYIVRKGSLSVSRRNSQGKDVLQTYVPAASFVGEMAILGDEAKARNATVRAAVVSELLYLDRSDLNDFLSLNPESKEFLQTKIKERSLENILHKQNEFRGELLNFVFAEGVTDADNVLVIDSDLCVGCDNCEKACSVTHGGTSRLDRKGGSSFASIQVPISCRHCENPLCMLDCPPDALERMPDGEVIIKDTCIACSNCVSNCPYGVIKMAYKNDGPWSLWNLFSKKTAAAPEAKATKCDMCGDLDGGPACVRSCPTGAAMRINPNALLELVK